MSFPNERKLITIFKSFVQKALIPNLRKNETSLFQWNKFASMITTDTLNYNQLHLYVDNLPNVSLTTSGSIPNHQNLLSNTQKNIPKRKQQIQNAEVGFNPHKTFGGQRSKLSPFMINQQSNEKRRQSQKQDSLRQKSLLNTNGILSSLDKLIRSLQQNHKCIQYQYKPHQRQGKSRDNQSSKRPSNLNMINNKSLSRPSNAHSTSSTPSYHYSQQQTSQSYRNYF